MGEQTKIQWCDHTFNPWVGCTKVSPGCANCYAEADMDKRRHFASWGPNGTRVMTSPANWKKPLKWNREAEKAGVKRVVFCASLADVFEDWKGPIVNSKGETLQSCLECGQIIAESIPQQCDCADYEPIPLNLHDLRIDLYKLIEETPHLIWRILTKRPENILDNWIQCPVKLEYPFRKNVQLYTSVENQEQADLRIPELLKCRDLVPVLGISAEPLLERIDLSEYLGPEKINHVIVGGESGPAARPFCDLWAGHLFIQASNAGIPFFMKQFGSNSYTGNKIDPNKAYQFNDSKGGDPEEWPEVFRVRELPEHFYSI